jgi:zinc resistance-associated protein
VRQIFRLVENRTPAQFLYSPIRQDVRFLYTKIISRQHPENRYLHKTIFVLYSKILESALSLGTPVALSRTQQAKINPQRRTDMTKNRALIITLALVAVVSLASLAAAGPGRSGGFGPGRGDCTGSGNCGWGPGYYRSDQIAQLTPEKQNAYRTIMQEFRDKMVPLRETMWQKRMELEALSPNPNTQPDEIKGLVKEIGALHTRMRGEREGLRDRLEKEIGLEVGQRGFHHPRSNKGQRGHQGRMGGGQRMMDGSGPGCNPTR